MDGAPKILSLVFEISVFEVLLPPNPDPSTLIEKCWFCNKISVRCVCVLCSDLLSFRGSVIN